MRGSGGYSAGFDSGSDTIGWEWDFFLNLPISVAGIVITYLVVRADDHRDPEGIDYLGMGVLTIGWFAMPLALDLGTRVGWSSPSMGACA